MKSRVFMRNRQIHHPIIITHKQSGLMKKTLFTLLAALAVTPALAGSLNPEDWSTLTPESFIFNEDGTMTVSGEYGELEYIGQEYKMVNGSSVAITLQFNNAEFLGEEKFMPSLGCYLNCYFTNGGFDYVGLTVAAYDGMLSIYNSADGIGDSVNIIDDYYSPTGDATTVTFLYSVTDNYLYGDYMLNGEPKATFCCEGAEVDTNSNWSMFLSNSDSGITVTDVTFTAPVPEPTTATLSLLALAGLAARRRRK